MRYDELVADGWLVLRFPWTRVTTSPVWVAEMIAAAVVVRPPRDAGMPRG